MSEKNNEKVNTFNSLFTTNHICMFKILLPYLDLNSQKIITAYIKISELMYTLSLLKTRQNIYFSNDVSQQGYNSAKGVDNNTILHIVDELIPFSTPEEKSRLSNISNMLSQYNNFKETYDMMKEFFPEGGNMSDIFSAFGGGMPEDGQGFGFDPSIFSSFFDSGADTE